MKKYLALFMAAALGLGTMACSNDTGTTTGADTTSAAVTTTADATTTAEGTNANTTTGGEAVRMAYTAGSYEVFSRGHNSDVKLNVTFTEDKISAIDVVEHGETAELFKAVEERLIPAIVSNQSLAVDTISGATKSSEAVLTSVAEAVAKAGADPEELKKVAVGPKEKGDDETIDTEVVVIGSGASGFVSAISAAKAGAKVVVLEKASTLAAVNGVKVSGPFAVNTPTLEERGTTLNVDEVFNHAMEYTHWTPNAALLKNCLERSKDAVGILSEVGYQFREANFRFETPFVDEKGGFHLILNPVDERVALWKAAYEDNGIEVRYETAGQELITDAEGKVTGVIAERADGSKLTVNAGAVIMATGGYLGNPEILKDRLGTTHVNAAAGGKSLCTGDGITMAQAVGAGLDKTFGLCMSEYGGTNAKASRPAMQDKFEQNMAFKFGIYGNLLVDKQGERFMNEGMMCDYPMSYGSEPTLRNSPYYAIVDQAYVDQMREIGLYEYMMGRGANTEDWFIGNYYKDRVLTTLDEDIEEGIREGWIVKADTIEELAEGFGLENLKETVDTYNQYAADGKDPLFDVKPMYLTEVSTGPFYAIENEVSAWSTLGGVRTDDDCRALTPENEVVDGLYIVGTDNGSLMYSPYYDIPGFAYGLSIDSGVIAGEHAASFAR